MTMAVAVALSARGARVRNFMMKNKNKNKNKSNRQNKQKGGLRVSFLKAEEERKRGIGHAPCAKPFSDPAR